MKRIAVILLSMLLLVNIGCKKHKGQNITANNQLLYEMDQWYLWYDKMPNVDPNNYPTPVELLNALTYKKLDRWSYISTKQEIMAYYDEAQHMGYGFGLAFDEQNNLWVTFIFKESPLRKHGVDRGWRLTMIENTPVTIDNVYSLLSKQSALFTFIKPNSEKVTIMASQAAFKMNTIIKDSVYFMGDQTIGYFMLKGFLDPTKDELQHTFRKFSDNNITDIIVDLRYNGGGSVDVAHHLANLLLGKSANQKVFATFAHNNKNTANNISLLFSPEEFSLNLNNIVFITTVNSASASELVINGLKPHTNISLVGGRTHGKPVGMYVFMYDEFDWAFVPICFSLTNSNNEADYFDGIPVDIATNDGVQYPFGSLQESSLAVAIGHITGQIKAMQTAHSVDLNYPEQKGLRQEIGAW